MVWLRNLLPAGTAQGNSTPENATRRAIGNRVFSGVGTSRLDPTKAVDFYLERAVWVARCVDSIATKLSALEIVFRNGIGEGAAESKDVDLDRILNRQANGYETGQALRYRLYTLALLSTRGVFVEKVLSASGGLAQLHVLPPGSVEPVPHPTEFVAGYWVNNVGGGREFLRPEQVLWIKMKPHPTDPYRALTPLESAGITVDTDYLARVFNRTFLQNDGRPGMLVAVKDLQPNDADYLKAQFGGGGTNAGKTTIIEGEGVDVADLSATPRDVQWLDALDNAKDTILQAFGVPEIAFGTASEKTFDNADAESVSYWTETLVPMASIFGRAFDSLTTGGLEDGVNVVHNTESIYSLQATRRARAQDLQNEVAAGLRSINDYNREMGYELSTAAEANVLWFNTQNLTPIGDPNIVKSIRDKMAAQQQEQQPTTRVESITQLSDGQQSTRQLARRVPSQIGPSNGGSSLRELAGAVGTQQSALKQLAKQANRSSREAPKRPNTLVKRARRHKSSGVDVETKEDDRAVVVDDRLSYEQDIEGVLNAALDTSVGVIVHRLNGTKMRHNTRHWTFETKASAKPTRVLRGFEVVQRDRWATAVGEALKARLLKIADDAARQMIEQYGIEDDVDLTQVLNLLNDRVVTEVLNRTDTLANLIDEAEQRGDNIDKISTRVSERGSARGWVKPFVVTLVTDTIESARAAVADRVGDMKKTWVAREDERTRPSHRRLSGKTVAVSQAFRVNGATIRRPGDPLAPIGETINCRCTLSYRV